MKQLLIATATISSLLLTANVHAEQSTPQKYIGGNLSFLSYEEAGLDADLIAVNGRFGAFFNPYIAAEMRLGLGLIGDEVDIFGTDVDIDLNYLIGAYVRAGVPVNDKVFPYLLLGYSRGELEASANGMSVDEAESDTSFGFGLDMKIDNKITLNAEYANLLDKEGAEISGFSVGATFKF